MQQKNRFPFLKLYTSTLVLLFSLLTFSGTRSSGVITSAWSGNQTSTAGTYYSNVSESATGSTLANNLKSVINSPTPNTSYDWGRYEAADEAEGQSDSVLLIYSRQVVKKNAHVSGSTGWNREHSFPQSKISSTAAKDNHHIFADDNKTNNSRGNKKFGEVTKSSSTQVKDGYGNLTDNYTTGSYFMPNSLAQGEVARATMYVNVLYGYSVTDNFASVALMLRWHLDNPVTNREIYRNNTVHTLQKNRNPFIDKPEYACRIWGATNNDTQALCASSGEDIDVTSVSVTPGNTSISLAATIKSVQLSATVLPSNATNKALTWTSSNTSVASVTANGYVTALSVGSATITARSVANNLIAGYASITVVNTPVQVTGVTLNQNTLTIPVNSSHTLIENVLPSGASNKSVTWSSSNPSIASVNNSGQVFANSEGSATITVITVDGGFSASAIVTVKKAVENEIISGHFYNSEGNSGAGEPTPERLNDGVGDVPGFGGLDVVKDTSATNVYYPRGGGLAIGSSGNSGNLTITLNDEYATNKIEVFFNLAGINDATPTLSGSDGTFTPGTPGTAYSNPSNGTPYSLIFNNPSTIFTITTTKRIAVVEINLYIGTTSEPTTEASAWAENFLGLTFDGCEAQSYALLSDAFVASKTSYLNLTLEAQTIIKETEPNAEGSDLEHALARYVVIVETYDLEAFITDSVANNRLSLRTTAVRDYNINFLPLLPFIFIIFILPFVKNNKK